MTKKTLLFLAAFFTLFTFLGHSVGTLIPNKSGSEAVLSARAVMENTLVEMPFGPPRFLAQMAYGGNAFISLYFLVSGFIFVLSMKPERFVRSIVVLNCMGLGVAAVFSLLFYFPLPAICTVLAAIFGLIASRR